MTSYTVGKASRYGEAEFLGNIDIGCEDFTEKQIEELRDIYCEKVSALLREFDETLTWFPSLSEVWGVLGETQTTPHELEEWWKEGNYNGRWENALVDAYAEIEKEWENRNARETVTKSWRVYGLDGHRQRVSFYYGMRLRGFSPGAQPKGVLRREDDTTGKYHDIIVYGRQLSAAEIAEYELDYLN